MPHIQEVPRHTYLLMRESEPKSLTVSRQLPMFDSRPIGNRFRFRISVKKMLRAWRYRDSVKEGAPLRPRLYRVATNACLESIFVVWFQASSETFQ